LSIANFSLPLAGDPSIGVKPRAIESISFCFLLLKTIHKRPAHSAKKTIPPITPPIMGPSFDDLCDPVDADFAAAVGVGVDVVCGVGETKE
jgi:hypothetical protein